MERISIKIILAACMASFLLGCSTIISHSQSGEEENIHAKRSLGSAIDDNAIVGKIESKLRAFNEQLANMVHVDAYNKIVLLTGRVPDKNFIEQATEIASSTPGVRQVHMEITRGQPTTISNYWYDAWLTTKVRSQLALTTNAPASKTKVRSFAGYVYIMGVMTPQEAKNAIYVVSRIPGAKKVISMIETVDSDGRALVSTPPGPQQRQPSLSPNGTPESSSASQDSNYVPPIELNANEEQLNGGFYMDDSMSSGGDLINSDIETAPAPSEETGTSRRVDENRKEPDSQNPNAEFQNDYQTLDARPQEVESFSVN